jgi:hypothetical protein
LAKPSDDTLGSLDSLIFEPRLPSPVVVDLVISPPTSFADNDHHDDEDCLPLDSLEASQCGDRAMFGNADGDSLPDEDEEDSTSEVPFNGSEVGSWDFVVNNGARRQRDIYKSLESLECQVTVDKNVFEELYQARETTFGVVGRQRRMNSYDGCDWVYWDQVMTTAGKHVVGVAEKATGLDVMGEMNEEKAKRMLLWIHDAGDVPAEVGACGWHWWKVNNHRFES